MFSFLKKKLKEGISKISEKIKGKGEVSLEERKEEIEIKKAKDRVRVEESKQKKEKKIEEDIEIKTGAESPRIKEETKKILKKEEIEKEETPKTEESQRIAESKEKKPSKGVFSFLTRRVTTTRIDEGKFEELFWDIEEGLLENNVAVEVIDRIKEGLKRDVVDVPLRRGDVKGVIERSLRVTLGDILSVESFSLFDKIKSKRPFVICFLGINGSGKTTTIAKVAYMLKKNGFSCVISASDTFRAASIEQLQLHADKLGVKLIKHNYKSDPAAVAYDAISHAKAKDIDVVLIDTAGRMHSNKNLMDEMRKIIRVAKPDLKIFIGESITGNDCIEQAKTFNEVVGIDGIVLAKADVDEKGGAAISVSYVIRKPILYLGVGQGYKDLQQFKPELVLEQLGIEA